MRRTFSGLVMALLALAANSDPPVASGIVVRNDYEFALVEVDESSGRLMVMGADVVEFCTGTIEFAFISFAEKVLQGGFRFNRLGKAEAITSVWPFTDFDCELFLTSQPLAVGMAHLVWTDNDWYGLDYCDEKNNMNAAGHMARGTLYSPAGERRQFSMETRILFDCDTLSFPLYRTKIKLSP